MAQIVLCFMFRIFIERMRLERHYCYYYYFSFAKRELDKLHSSVAENKPQ